MKLKKLKQMWPFVAFATIYPLIFYFWGYLDALFGKEEFRIKLLGTTFFMQDLYFMCLTIIFIFLVSCLVLAFVIAHKKVLSLKKFIYFVVMSTAILPLSVWGIAWMQWAAFKPGPQYLTLWKIGLLKLSIYGTIFFPFHILMLLFYLAIVGFIIHKSIKK